jgi:hypothetical protein
MRKPFLKCLLISSALMVSTANMAIPLVLDSETLGSLSLIIYEAVWF